VRRRVLAEAAGIPLALVDLPAALTDAQLTDPRRPPAVLPLTDRLRAPFGAAVRELPDSTAELLLLMAVGGSIRDVAGSVRDMAGSADRTVAGDIEPAMRAGLVGIDPRTGWVSFRHPLARATVLEQSAEADRRRAHGLLAQLLSDQPDRWVWHLAESTSAADERIAALLDRAAIRAQRSGDAARAADLLERSAELSPTPAERAWRLARAAYLSGRVMGELGRARALLADAGQAGPRSGSGVQMAIGSAFLELNGGGDVAAAHSLLVGALEAHQGSAGDPGFVEALHNLLEVCLSSTDIDRFAAFRNQMSRVAARAAPELILRARLLADCRFVPAGTPAALDRSISEIHDENDATRIIRIAALALSVDRLADCREPLWRLVRDGRAGGAIRSAIDALAMLALDGYHAGRWDEAQELANEGVALCESVGYRHASWPFRYVIAMLAAARGDDTVLAAQTEAMDLWAGPRGVGSVLADARRARALGALGKGDYQQAYRLLDTFGASGMFDGSARDAAAVMFDLIEAAVRTDRETEALDHVSAIRRSGIAERSPRAAMLAAAAAAIASSASDLPDAFEEALAVPGVDRWPFELARVRLAYGARLRRAHGVVQARSQLAAALDVFTELGARPWAARAETELFATGMTRAPSGGVGPGSLTHQERAVAELAAAGLTNKQIAHRLFVSSRTVGAHLRQIFAKLGITSRAAIGDLSRRAVINDPGRCAVAAGRSRPASGTPSRGDTQPCAS
jgi:DNA-binding CsgD family transcriptional regulator